MGVSPGLLLAAQILIYCGCVFWGDGGCGALVVEAHRLAYPYEGFLAQAQAEGWVVPIFAYGSLIDTTSASRTISRETLATARPAVAHGVRRLFNHDLPACTMPHWGEPSVPCARAFLNVEEATSADVVNGVVYFVCASELTRLAEREILYDLITVPYYVWEKECVDRCHVNYTQMHIAYTYSAPTVIEGRRRGVRAERNKIAPREGYYEMTLDAARRLGREFYCMFCETTFLADGCTSIFKVPPAQVCAYV